MRFFQGLEITHIMLDVYWPELTTAAGPKYRRPSVLNSKHDPFNPFCVIVGSGTSKDKGYGALILKRAKYVESALIVACFKNT